MKNLFYFKFLVIYLLKILKNFLLMFNLFICCFLEIILNSVNALLKNNFYIITYGNMLYGNLTLMTKILF